MGRAAPGSELQDRPAPPGLHRHRGSVLRADRPALSNTLDHCWIDGSLRPVADARVRADDSALVEGRGCYTTARVVDGRARFADHHVRRLQRDARVLGLPDVDEKDVLRAFDELGRAAFGHGEGVVRIQASRDGEGVLHLLARVREVGPEPDTWRAVTSPLRHPGPMPWGGVKVTNHLFYALATAAATEAGADEALLFDAADRVVEGCRSNLVVVRPDGEIVSPDPAACGAVAGVCLEVLREREPALQLGDVTRRDLAEAREVVALNALRGARPIVAIDDRAVGDGEAGPWSRRLAEHLTDG